MVPHHLLHLTQQTHSKEYVAVLCVVDVCVRRIIHVVQGRELDRPLALGGKGTSGSG